MDTLVVFLVHGTFARGAQWVRDDSPLSETILQALQGTGARVVLRPFLWSGRNKSADRITAATALNVEFENACAEYPDAGVLFIGHSHGGSVIAYFWRALSEERKARISGTAFLSTPFIATRMRPDWRELIAALGVVIAIAVYTAGMTVVSYLDWRFTRLTWDAHAGKPWVTALFFLIGIAGLAPAEWARRRVIRWGDRVTRALSGSIGTRDTTRLPGGNSVFLRTTGDEAAVTLAVGQFAMWLIGILNLASSRVILRVRDALTRTSLGAAAGLLIAGIYALWVGGVAADWFDGFFSSSDLGGASHEIDTGIAALDRLLQDAVWYFSPIFTLLFTAAIGFILFVVIGILCCLVALWAAGWTGITDGLFTEIAIEPVPLGATRLQHLDWDAPTDGTSLRHSYTYTNPDALKAIGDWVRNTFHNRR